MDSEINNWVEHAPLYSFSHLEMGFYRWIIYFICRIISFVFRAWKMHVPPWFRARPSALNARRHHQRYVELVSAAAVELGRKSESTGRRNHLIEWNMWKMLFIFRGCWRHRNVPQKRCCSSRRATTKRWKKYWTEQFSTRIMTRVSKLLPSTPLQWHWV